MKYRIELVKHMNNTDQILIKFKDESNTFGIRFDSDWPIFMVDSLKKQLISEFKKNDKYFWINKLHIVLDDLKLFLGELNERKTNMH